MAIFRVFSYLPNPRVRKTTIAARFANIEVEIRGAPAKELRDRLWDDDAHSLPDNERSALVSTIGRVGLTGVPLQDGHVPGSAAV
jgi:elongation factor 1-gamma